MSESIQTIDAGIGVFSMVVPSVNGDSAKLVVVTKAKLAKILETTQANREAGGIVANYALFMQANLHHEFIQDGFTGSLTAEQFDVLVRDDYNKASGWDKKGNPLNEIEPLPIVEEDYREATDLTQLASYLADEQNVSYVVKNDQENDTVLFGIIALGKSAISKIDETARLKYYFKFRF